MTAHYLPMPIHALVLALSTTVHRCEDSEPARWLWNAGVASRERTIALVVERAVASESAGEGRG